jgi:hypothetical protein
MISRPRENGVKRKPVPSRSAPQTDTLKIMSSDQISSSEGVKNLAAASTYLSSAAVKPKSRKTIPFHPWASLGKSDCFLEPISQPLPSL